MKKDNENKKKIVISIIGILLLMLITVGVTAALFMYTRLGTTENFVTTGTMKFIYIENAGVGNGINITDALPVTDQVGKTYNTENYVFDFKVEATNMGSEAIPYEVTLRKKSDSRLNESNVKIYLTDMTGDADTELVAPTLYSDLVQTKINVGNEVEKTLFNGVVAGRDLSYEKNFRLRMWIKEDADYSKIAGQTFTAMVNVYSNVPLVEDSVGANSTKIKRVGIGNINATKVEGQAYDYDLVLDQDLNNVTIDVELDNPNATVDSIEKIDSLTYNNSNIKRLATSENFNVEKGDNYFKITVTSEDKTSTSEYKLRVEVPDEETPDKLVNKIMKNQVIESEPTFSESNDDNGLYKSTATNDGSPTYYFRGDIDNNHIEVAGFTWLVVRINEDGTIRLLMQDGINNNTGYKFNSNNNTIETMYYSNSEVKSVLETWYQENIVAKGYSNKVATLNNYFCEQAKVRDYMINSGTELGGGNATMELYSDYIPNFKCEEDGNGYGIVNESIGLLTYDEVVHIGGCAWCNPTKNYLNFIDINHIWTMSPSGYADESYWAGSEEYNSSELWSFYTSGRLSYSSPLHELRLNPVINLKADTMVTGLGTADSPWVVQ